VPRDKPWAAKIATLAKPQNITPDQKSFGALMRISVHPAWLRTIQSASRCFVNGGDLNTR
jgi:hypothetical protein